MGKKYFIQKDNVQKKILKKQLHKNERTMNANP